ncbi:MAG: YbaY family lipoprotein [Chloroflexaceae bacterium]|nr:YbaY family lipoprotein [Chloroflexaceae bacterium]
MGRNPAGLYAVRATITVDGVLRYTSTRIYPIIAANNPGVVEIVVEPV